MPEATDRAEAETEVVSVQVDPDQLEILLDRLRAMGERITVARRAVLETLLAEPDSHLSADELARRIHRDHPSIHLSTVYRTVEFLTDTGLLTEVRVGHGPSSYHFATDTHHHAVCNVCGAEVALPANLFDAVTIRLRREHGFESDPHHLTIPGICADCQATGRTAPSPGQAHAH
jgi:Fur family ferric uptake transcriptional regulator